MFKRIGLAVVCLALVACSSAVKKVDEAPKPTEIVSPPPVKAPPAKPATVAQVDSESAKLARAIAELTKKSVYFEYDDFTVKAQFQSVVKEQAAFILKTPNDKVMIEGNADERGSAEYNLALGQKRAEAVRKALVILGVPDSRIEAISYGKEKPRTACHEEQCWQENRRVDFVHAVK